MRYCGAGARKLLTDLLHDADKKLERSSDLDSSAPAVPVKCIKFAKDFKSKISKICPRFFCILAHRSRVPSFVRIREKL